MTKKFKIDYDGNVLRGIVDEAMYASDEAIKQAAIEAWASGERMCPGIFISSVQKTEKIVVTYRVEIDTAHPDYSEEILSWVSQAIDDAIGENEAYRRHDAHPID